jgi:hypothetical protein
VSVASVSPWPRSDRPFGAWCARGLCVSGIFDSGSQVLATQGSSLSSLTRGHDPHRPGCSISLLEAENVLEGFMSCFPVNSL